MARRQEKQEAIALRKKGKSYGEIHSALGINKSTLSGWLKDFPLSDEQREHCTNKKVENYIATRKRNRELLFKRIYEEEKIKVLPLSARDIFIGGLFLYLGEGGKTQMNDLSLSNTDPAMIKGFIIWIKNLGGDASRMYFRLHLYKDMDSEKEIEFWCAKLEVSRLQFRKSYIKKSNLIGLSYKNGYGHGTCNAHFGNAILGKRIFMSLKVIKDYLMGQ